MPVRYVIREPKLKGIVEVASVSLYDVLMREEVDSIMTIRSFTSVSPSSKQTNHYQLQNL